MYTMCINIFLNNQVKFQNCLLETSYIPEKKTEIISLFKFEVEKYKTKYSLISNFTCRI